MYDLVIVGGGPAGATLARLLGNEHRILILDRRDLGQPFSGGQEKCCGGLLAPDAQSMLAGFGLGLPSSVLVGPQLFTVRTMDLAAGRERYYPRDYINVDREKFDRWLVSLIPPRVERRWSTLFRDLEQREKGYRVSFSQGGKDESVETRLVVGADGALSRVRAGLGMKLPMYIAIQEWFEAEKPLPYYSAIFDPKITDFYAWTIPKEETILVGAAIPAGIDVQVRFELLKHKLGRHGYTLGKSLKRRGCHLVRPSSPREICLGKDGIFLIGEAAGWISPSSAEGLSYAFRSALALARAIAGGKPRLLAHYRRQCRGLYLNILGKLAKSPGMYWPFLRQMAMASGLFSLELLGKDFHRETEEE
ncbi:MAG: FAD-binding protein [Bacillota bacterium]|jgi:geranylgeranyl reductase